MGGDGDKWDLASPEGPPVRRVVVNSGLSCPYWQSNHTAVRYQGEVGQALRRKTSTTQKSPSECVLGHNQRKGCRELGNISKVSSKVLSRAIQWGLKESHQLKL